MIKKIDKFEIPSNAIVKQVSYGKNIKEIMYMNVISHTLESYKKISKDEVINIESGEIIKCKMSDTRKDNIVSLKRTIKKLRDLINCNFEGSYNELFITMTYKENMRDYKKLYNDFKKFYQKLKRRFNDIEFKYIYVIEPQGRGSWHIHLLLKGINVDYLYIDNSVIAELWNQGFCKTQRLSGVDNVGAYLSAYLTDIIDEKGSKKKGARLYLYPAGINLYRCSRNCLKPVEEWINYNSISYKEYKTYEQTYEVLDDIGERKNLIKKEYYNMKRKK